MFRLNTLGALDLREDGKPPVAEALAQPKRVVLLAYLALHGGGYVRRDTLLALLWPELDTDRARHSLRQSLYLLRRWLDADVIVKRGEEELAIAPERLWCDAVAFQTLLREGRAEDALALYRGDFLAGFHVPEASDEFEDWLARVRQEYRGLALKAAAGLVKDARRKAEWDTAVEFARWAVSADPLNERAQIELITLLGDRGDAAGARRAYKAFADRLERELGGTPSPATRQALDRADRAPPAESPGSAPPGAPALAAPKPEAVPAPQALHRTLPSRIRVFAVAGAAGLTLVLAWSLLNRGPEKRSAVPVLAVAPILQIPAGGDSAEARAIGDLLATSLARLPTMQVLSGARLLEVEQSLGRRGTPVSAVELARRAQATELLEGTVHRVEGGGDSLVLELRRVDVRSGKVLHGYRAAARDVFTLVDRATAGIASADEVARPAEPIADVTTRSLVAFRFYQEGLRSLFNSDLTAARRLFQSAVGEDSTFAMATWYLARLDAAMERPEVWDQYVRALNLASGASERERLLITADFLRADSRATAAIYAESLATRFPSDPYGLWLLGIVTSFSADFPRAVTILRRAIALDSALEVRPGPVCRLCDAYEALVEVYVSADSSATARAVAEEYARRVPGSARAWATVGTVAWAQEDSLRAAAAHAEIRKLVPGVSSLGITAALLRLLWRGDYELALERLLSASVLHPDLRSEARWFSIIALRNQGRLREALQLAEGRVPPHEPMALLNLADDSINISVIRFEQGNPGTCIVVFSAMFNHPQYRELGKQWYGRAARERAWALGRAAMCLAGRRDTSGLAGVADTLETLGAISGYGRDQRLHHYVRGLLWKARGNQERAVAEFRAAISSPNLGFTRINYELAGSLLSLQRPAEAVAILQPALRGALDASNLYITRTELHELLAQAWDAAGRQDSARAHWAWVDRAWARADAPFRDRWERAHRMTGGR